MFKLVSFRMNGSQVETANEVPAFFGLEMQGRMVGYFNTVEAANYARESIEVALVVEVDTTTGENVFYIDEEKLAA